jgi:hypothetical protein
MRRLILAAPLAGVAMLLAGCGGGGGGGGADNAPGTFVAGSDRPGLSTFSPNVKSASPQGADVQITGDERTGAVLNFTTSRRLTLTLYGPVTVRSYTVNNTRLPGTCMAVYVVTQKASNGTYYTESEWRGTGGSVNVTATDSSHIEATFNAGMLNVASSATFQFTNGKLNLTYESPPPPPG